MAIMGYSAFPKALLEPHHSLVSYPGHSLEESYLTEEIRLVYSTAPVASISCLSAYKLSRVIKYQSSPVGWGCRIHELHLYKMIRPPPHNDCSAYDTKAFDTEVPVLEILGIWSTP